MYYLKRFFLRLVSDELGTDRAPGTSNLVSRDAFRLSHKIRSASRKIQTTIITIDKIRHCGVVAYKAQSFRPT
jgi:hypothetical protein